MKNWTIVAAAACGVMAAPAVLADTRGDVTSAIARCGVIHDDRVWLDCVYGAQQPMRAQLGLPPAPEYQQRLVPGANVALPPPPQQQQQQRLAVPARPRKKPGFFESFVTSTPKSEAVRMAAYRFEKGGGFVVELENGQEWRQTEVEGGTANWDHQPSAYRVLITDGAFGTYNLRTIDDPRIYKVKRVR